MCACFVCAALAIYAAAAALRRSKAIPRRMMFSVWVKIEAFSNYVSRKRAQRETIFNALCSK
jgi:hypothetical protein